MAMSSSTISFQPLSLPKILSSHSKTTFPSSLFTFPSSFNPLPELSSLQPSHSSRFFRNLAAALPYELGDGDDEQLPNYSPDLKVYVGNLPWNVDSAALAELFQRAGNVEMVEVVYDKVSGRSKGFGFVTMSSIKEVEMATRLFNGYELDGRLLRVNSGPPRSRGSRDGGRSSFGGGGRSSDNTNKVYVGNLAWSIDNLALETLFQDQGNVTEARVIYDRDTSRSKGFGFVTYSSVHEVDSAIKSLDGLKVDGRNIRVTVAEARQRNEF